MSELLEIAPDCFLARDTCNVYLLRYGDRALAIDFGTGAWQSLLGTIGVRRLEHVVVTHAHRDQVCGLYRQRDPQTVVHVPAGDGWLLAATTLREFWLHYQDGGCPSCYAAPRQPVPGVCTDMAGDCETQVGPARFCSIATPGHTPGALSYVVEWHGRQLVFCGDAVHAGGTLHEPYHLEWDHWTPGGCLAAWYGLERLGACRCDMLLPAHGPVVGVQGRACIARTQRRLLELIRVKGSVCAGARQRWVDAEPLACGAWRLLPHLYRFGANSYLVIGAGGEGLVIDPWQADLAQLDPLLEETGARRIDVATASHYHADHSDGLNALRERFGTSVWLHPRVAEPLLNRDLWDVPWLPRESVRVDRLLPLNGSFGWSGYRFTSHDFPGQTRWHTAIDGHVDGCHVLFSGDNYQPPTRWNGTGGFCAYNGSRFDAHGFGLSAARALAIGPDMVCNGHGCAYWFDRDQYRRILRWARRAGDAVRNLCPGDDWLTHYDPRLARWEPFVARVERGAAISASLVVTNHRPRPAEVRAEAMLPCGWRIRPRRLAGQVPAHGQRRWRLRLQTAADAAAGRHVLTADIVLDGELLAEAGVMLVDVLQPPAPAAQPVARGTRRPVAGIPPRRSR